jgi:hypothetical protein
MENVILSCADCPHKANRKAYSHTHCYTHLCREAQARHLLRILKEPCTEHRLPVYSVLNINLPAHRYDCPECMKQIEKEIEG